MHGRNVQCYLEITVGFLLGFNQTFDRISHFKIRSQLAKFQAEFQFSELAKFLDESTKVYSLLIPRHEIPEPLLMCNTEPFTETTQLARNLARSVAIAQQTESATQYDAWVASQFEFALSRWEEVP